MWEEFNVTKINTFITENDVGWKACKDLMGGLDGNIIERKKFLVQFRVVFLHS